MRGGDVHDADALPIRAFRQQAGDLHFDDSGTHQHAQRSTPLQVKPARGGWTQQYGICREELGDLGSPLWQERRLHLRGAQRIETDNPERALLAEDRHFQFDRRVGGFDLRPAGDPQV